MKAHTEFPALEQLPAAVHRQRRRNAAYVRTKHERQESGKELDDLLASAGVDAVTCELPLGTFEVRRQVASSGERYASVTPIKP